MSNMFNLKIFYALDRVVVDKAPEIDPGVIIQRITTVLYTVVGIVSVIMIIIGAILYIVSGGDPAKVQQAKNTLLYAVVGLAIAILAYAIAVFVAGKVIFG